MGERGTDVVMVDRYRVQGCATLGTGEPKLLALNEFEMQRSMPTSRPVGLAGFLEAIAANSRRVSSIVNRWRGLRNLPNQEIRVE